MSYIALHEYFGPWDDNVADDLVDNAETLLEKVNGIMEIAFEKGQVDFILNPKTGTHVAGSTMGGFRPADAKIGAARSAHKEGKAVDIYDPHHEFAIWCVRHQDVLRGFGLYMEHPDSTPGWVHLTTRPPVSGKTVFMP